jgi:hypothetical protein
VVKDLAQEGRAGAAAAKVPPCRSGERAPFLGHPFKKERKLWIYHSMDLTVLIKHSTVESHYIRVILTILGRRGSENQYLGPDADRLKQYCTKTGKKQAKTG